MGLFTSIFGPKRVPSGSPIRETLFGDCPIEQWPGGDEVTDLAPWALFVEARKCLAASRQPEAVALWLKVLEQPNFESRHYLQAWSFLRQHGREPSPDIAKQVLGVVVEVAMPSGLDLLAAYADLSARYYNYSGSGVVWEHPDATLDPVIDELLECSRIVVSQIGPWEEARPGPPPSRSARMSFLTPSGLHFGQGPMDALAKDPLGGRVLHTATKLMQELIAKTK